VVGSDVLDMLEPCAAITFLKLPDIGLTKELGDGVAADAGSVSAFWMRATMLSAFGTDDEIELASGLGPPESPPLPPEPAELLNATPEPPFGISIEQPVIDAAQATSTRTISFVE